MKFKISGQDAAIVMTCLFRIFWDFCFIWLV